MSIQEHVNQVKANIAAAAQAAGRDPDEITLCAATKVQTDDTIRAAIAAGITVCGENRVQELTAHLAADAYRGAQVHFIGHLQTNKVKQVVGKVDLIHSVDSERLGHRRPGRQTGPGSGYSAGGQHRRRGEQGGLHPGGGPWAGPADPGAGARPPAGPDGNSTHLPGTWGQPPVFCRYATAFC